MQKSYIQCLTFLVAVLCLVVIGNSQTIEKHQIKGRGWVDDNVVLVRWAPTDAVTWNLCNESGYHVVRYTMMRDGKFTDASERSVPVQLTAEPIKPWPAGDIWRPLMERNDFGAIAAQAIYGERFNPVIAEDANRNMTNAIREIENRYGFGLFSADQSFEVAEAMGLGLKDRNIQPNEHYLYRIFPATLQTVQIDTGYVYARADQREPLPLIQDVGADFADGKAMVYWDLEFASSFYTSYNIERSFDGVDWEVRNAAPFIYTRKDANDMRAFFADTFGFNGKPVFYRIVGRTPFDIYGPPSEPVQGFGKDPLPSFFPEIREVVPDGQGGFSVQWEFNPAQEDRLKGFHVLRSSSFRGIYEQLNDPILSVKDRFYIDENPMPSNYYKVIGVDQYDRRVESFAALAQPDDDIPPAPPKNVRGKILPTGEMVITWDKNEEIDFMGNRVYMSNNPNNEFTQITPEPTTDGYYIHRVTLNTLTEEVWVMVNSVDYRQNTSAFSEVAKIMRPDTVAPSAPLFTFFESSPKMIKMEWVNSSAHDLMQQKLYRSPLGADDWTLLATYDMPQDQDQLGFVDSVDLVVGARYEYKLVAEDDAMLTTSSPILNVQVIDDFIREDVSNLQATVDRRAKEVILTWDYPMLAGLSYFKIYRSLKEQAPVTYSTIDVDVSLAAFKKKKTVGAFQFNDVDVDMNTIYTYRVKAIFDDGGESPLSKIIEISY
jgi:fibronectin type 3 domain-containing protein